MSIPENALKLGQDVPTTFEHTKHLPTTFDKKPYNYHMYNRYREKVRARGPRMPASPPGA